MRLRTYVCFDLFVSGRLLSRFLLHWLHVAIFLSLLFVSVPIQPATSMLDSPAVQHPMQTSLWRFCFCVSCVDLLQT